MAWVLLPNLILVKVVIQLLNGIIVRSCSNIQHEGKLGLYILADCLEEPPMGVNLTVVSLLYAEHEVDSTTFEDGLIDTEVPSSHLETMKKVLGDLRLVHARLHDVLHALHFKFRVSAHLHETLLEESLLIKKAFVARYKFEALRYLIVAVADDGDKEVILGKPGSFVHFEGVVVMEAA